ncbi:hypothetical protein ElyMa_006449300 [Elysia marginata]|uniref:Uncharacterized protein n=1 Tax=Elysia marginata TaxID=1093978 RepID=A0AAV4HZ38_9GAST|nr:hypothetical protein ElyMa_006449300 [Elysia marginata]
MKLEPEQCLLDPGQPPLEIYTDHWPQCIRPKRGGERRGLSSQICTAQASCMQTETDQVGQGDCITPGHPQTQLAEGVEASKRPDRILAGLTVELMSQAACQTEVIPCIRLRACSIWHGPLLGQV